MNSHPKRFKKLRFNFIQVIDNQNYGIELMDFLIIDCFKRGCFKRLIRNNFSKK